MTEHICNECGLPVGHIYGLHGRNDSCAWFWASLAFGLLFGCMDFVCWWNGGPTDWDTLGFISKLLILWFFTPIGWWYWAARAAWKIHKYDITYCNHGVMS